MVVRNLESTRPRKGTQRFLSSLAVCAIAVVANFAGSQIARAFGLPLYLDCVGTIVASLLGGYLPGIIVGYATNLIVGLVADSMMLYFAIVNVLVSPSRNGVHACEGEGRTDCTIAWGRWRGLEAYPT